MRDRPGGAHRRLLVGHEDDPLSGVANLFDVAMVFAVAILLVLFARAPMLATIASPGARNQPGGSDNPAGEAAVVDGQPLEHYRESDNELTGRGERLGVAYRLENGDVVYVPN